MRDPADMSHAELVVEVRRLRVLLASYLAAQASSDGAGGAAPGQSPEADGGLIHSLMRERGLQLEDLARTNQQLRTELAVVVGVTESLLAETYGPLNGRQRQALDMVEKSGYRLVALLI